MTTTMDSVIAGRAGVLFDEHRAEIHGRTDRLFAWLMIAQWIAGTACALWISPRTWIGATSTVNPHVWAAIVLGALISAAPIAMVLLRPGRAATRHVIAAAQMLWSALLIDLTGGRIETHFHVFGSLAFLAFYRDWSVLVTASAVVAADHLIRGLVWPESVFGVAVASRWRWLEHAGWVLFEDGFLIASCVRGLRELHAIAVRQARLEAGKTLIEHEVRERTSQLQSANESLAANQRALSAANDELQRVAREREALHNQLLTASRQAGMAEVATGVLHNVGNVLNSVNVAASVASERVRNSEVASLARASKLLSDHSHDLPRFLSADERGRHLPAFLVEIARVLGEDQRSVMQELGAVARGVEHIKHIVSMQQAHAKRTTLIEVVTPADVMDQAVQMQQDSLTRHAVAVERRYEDLAPLALDKHRAIQILLNLIQNANRAMRNVPAGGRRLTLSIAAQANQVCFTVEDCGDGIAPENLSRIFAIGFTTREDGHGFGLHSAATAAQEMGGSLTAHSEGPGQGARFALLLPSTRPAPATAGGPSQGA